MEWKDNFSELILISEQPVIFVSGLKTIKCNLLKAKDVFLDTRIQYAISLLSEDNFMQLVSFYPRLEFDNVWQLLHYLISTNRTEDELLFHMKYLLEKCFEDQFQVKNNKWYINDTPLDGDLFNRVVEIIHISSGLKDIKEQNKYKEYKTKEMIALEQKIKAIKNQANNFSEQDNFLLINKIFIQLNYELGYKYEELFNMNFFHIKILHSYVTKIIEYDLAKRASSNGLLKKKLKYFTD